MTETTGPSHSVEEKRRMRTEIEAQIREFLYKGGRIEVVNDSEYLDLRRPRSVGHLRDGSPKHELLGA
ncbi:MAG: hypothetical protein AAGA91_10170 [Pseudomonadota bacterium]